MIAHKRERFVSYFRVSTDQQGRSGLGLEAQNRAIAQYVQLVDGEIVDAPFTEIESGRRCDRPQLMKAIASAKRHKATLLIAKLDRLARNVAFVSAMLESGVELRAVDMPAANRMMLQLVAVMGEYEVGLISERTKAALAARRARGFSLGTVANLKKGNPGAIAKLKAEAQEAAERMRPIIDNLKAEGVSTVRGLCVALNERGYVTATGSAWHPTSVARVLRRIGRGHHVTA
jgi:DNA invertase Pin-like site-specific DNA recombinase